MTARQLEQRQLAIERKIANIARENNLITDDIDPIYDGVGDFSTYLSQSPKIAWVLKEPYDEINKETGLPEGGGWSIPRDCFMKEKWDGPTFRRVIYCMVGIRNNQFYEDIDWLRDNYSIGRVLKSTVWINLSKMPARTISDYNYANQYERYWRDTFNDQIRLYDPDIIIFGNTFGVCRDCFVTREEKPVDIIHTEEYGCMINVFRSGKRILLDAYHPGCLKQEWIYVDSIIKTVKKHWPLQ